MLREFLRSVAVVVFISAPGFADINQSQGFAIGLSSDVSLFGGWGTAGDTKFLAVDLSQTATQGADLSAGQQVQPSMSGFSTQGFSASLAQQSATSIGGVSPTTASYESIAGGLQIPDSVSASLSGGQLSLFNSLSLLGN